MIQVDDAAFRYGEGGFSLSVPRLEVAAGETVGMIGPSGSGKTTLLNLVAGIIVPIRGRVCVGGVEVNRLHDRARRVFRVRSIGLVFQEFELVEHLDVLDNVLLPYRISPALDLTREVRGRAEDLAFQVGLGGSLRRNVQRLSQGERQRVAICRALLPEPPLLLCDEPTGNLDPVNKRHVLDLLLEQVQHRGTTLLTVTHDHELLPRFGRVIDFMEFHQPAAPP